MATTTKKKAGYKSPFKKGTEGVKKQEGKNLEKEQIKDLQVMLAEIGSGKKSGIIIVMEEFTEGSKKGMQGVSFCQGVKPTDRVQALVSASGMPAPLFAIVASMIKED